MNAQHRLSVPNLRQFFASQRGHSYVMLIAIGFLMVSLSIQLTTTTDSIEPLTVCAALASIAALIGVRRIGRQDTEISYKQYPPPSGDSQQPTSLDLLVLQYATELIALLDENGNFRYVSPSQQRLLNHNPDDLIGLHCQQIIHPDDWKITDQRWAEARQRGTTHVTCRVARRSGEWRWMEARIEHIDYAGERLNLLIARDITELYEREAHLLQAQRTLLVGSMANNMAHDINNLLAVIEGSASLAAESIEPTHIAHEDLAAITQASQRASSFTRQLLSFIRQHSISLRQIHMGQVLSAIDQLVERIAGQTVQVTMDVAPDLWLVQADRNQIEQIIINMAVNARDAMPKGGKLNFSLHNRVTQGQYGEEPGDYVCLCIRDSGVGMSAEVRQRLFEPFYTTKASSKGTGLGLTTCRCIIEQLNGFIQVESQVGAGSTFSVFIPRHIAKNS